jgi:signal transduction histidine kinase
MQALRRRFVLVAAAVLIPVALLVWRAVASVEFERRMRHQVVAERVFDEMERSLSELLAQEETRPFEDYGTSGAVPLIPGPEQPFVVGWFAIDPDGDIRVARTGHADVRRQVAPLRAGAQPPAASLPLAQRPGSTVDAQAPARLEDKKDVPTAFGVLRSLNKAVEQRAAKQKQVVDEYALKAAPAAKDAELTASLDGARGRTAAEPVPRRDADTPAMVGRIVEAQQLALYRTIAHDGRTYRQGLLLDVPALGAWLAGQALAGSELASYATVTFATGAIPAASAADPEFVYSHRFAEPFADVGARLSLRALPGIGGAGYVYALSALLVVAMAAGLLALYRMVAVAVGFAERRGNFVAAVSHELKTPLTAIRMYGEMLRDGIVPSEAKRDEYHRHITAESERLSRLINNVLEFSKLEKGTRPVSLTEGPVGPVLEEAAELLGPHATQAGFTLRVEVEPGLPPARFERDALLQILFNLVDNAVKYAASATRREIVMSATRSGDRVVIAVRDFGPGVPEAQLGKIFEPFYRGEQELTRRSKGTGLGLALVRGLGENMGALVRGANCVGDGFEVAIALRD